jgi:quercetin dioxygenase-like cupin family protein
LGIVHRQGSKSHVAIDRDSSGVKLMPHRHPEDRVYTVMSGVFYIGLGDQFDGDKVEAYPPGSVIVLPGNTSHFHWAKSGEYVIQVRPLVRWASNTWSPATIPAGESPVKHNHRRNGA